MRRNYSVRSCRRLSLSLFLSRASPLSREFTSKFLRAATSRTQAHVFISRISKKEHIEMGIRTGIEKRNTLQRKYSCRELSVDCELIQRKLYWKRRGRSWYKNQTVTRYCKYLKGCSNILSVKEYFHPKWLKRYRLYFTFPRQSSSYRNIFWNIYFLNIF